ncbi:MAG: hypothetical protein JSS49_00435 [Planctomycetes bacterium]|nr:hypothetical protein [Planctomycetota bacterium]
MFEFLFLWADTAQDERIWSETQILSRNAEGETLLTEMSDRELLDFVALDITRAAEESVDG